MNRPISFVWRSIQKLTRITASTGNKETARRETSYLAEKLQREETAQK